MGTNVTNSVQKSLYKETVNTVNKNVQTAEASSNASADLVQQAKISCRACKLKNGCKIRLNQKGQAAAAAMLQSDNKMGKEQVTDLKTKLKTAMDSEIKQKNKGLNLGNTNVSNLKKEAETIIEKNTENIMKSSVKNTVRASASNAQVAEINMDGSECDGAGSSIVLDQEGLSKAIAQNFAKNIMEDLQKTKAYQDVSTEMKDKVTQSNEGLSLAGLLGSLGLAALGPMAPCCICCCCVCCLAAPALMSQGGEMGFSMSDEISSLEGDGMTTCMCALILVLVLVLLSSVVLKSEGFSDSSSEASDESSVSDGSYAESFDSDASSIATYESSDFEEEYFPYEREEAEDEALLEEYEEVPSVTYIESPPVSSNSSWSW